MIYRRVDQGQVWYKFDKLVLDYHIDISKFYLHPQWPNWYGVYDDYRVEFLLKFSDDICDDTHLIIHIHKVKVGPSIRKLSDNYNVEIHQDLKTLNQKSNTAVRYCKLPIDK